MTKKVTKKPAANKAVLALIKLVKTYSDNPIFAKQVIGGLAYSLSIKVPKSQARAAMALTELREMAESNNGSEVAGRRLDQKSDYANKVFDSFQALQALFEDTKVAYEEASGDKWMPFVKTGASGGNPIEVTDNVSNVMDNMAKVLEI